MENKGVCIVATGHPYYGRMAFNLAKTIKAIDRTCRIQIVADGTSLTHISKGDLWVFDIITNAMEGNGFKLKLHVDEWMAFDECLLLDADCAWVSSHSPIELIDQLSTACDFTAITEGVYNIDKPEQSDLSAKYYLWANADDLINAYNLRGKIYQWRTELMYIKRCEKTCDMLGAARRIYDTVQADVPSLQLFAQNVPDEIGINVAACMCDMHPHKYKWQPTFWHRLHNDNAPQVEDLCNNYYALSCGSNVSSMNVKKLYDRIVKAASYKLGMQHVFPLISKRDIMPTRQRM